MTENTYATLSRDVDALIRKHSSLPAEFVAYLIMRAAMLHVRAVRSPENTASLAYRLADEFATLDAKL